jgi:hypothetical protein
MRVFKNISANIANDSLLLINRLAIREIENKENTLIARFVVKQLSFTMTIPITQTSVVWIKNVTIPLEFRS